MQNQHQMKLRGMYITSVMQVCCVIENSARFTKQKDTKGFETTFSVAMSLLQSIGSMDYIYTSKFQTSVRQLLRVIANLSKSYDGASAMDIHHYSARSALRCSNLLFLQNASILNHGRMCIVKCQKYS